jgi:hypothetical protein
VAVKACWCLQSQLPVGGGVARARRSRPERAAARKRLAGGNDEDGANEQHISHGGDYSLLLGASAARCRLLADEFVRRHCGHGVPARDWSPRV